MQIFLDTIFFTFSTLYLSKGMHQFESLTGAQAVMVKVHEMSKSIT